MITVGEIVRGLLSQEGKNTTHEYLRYLHIAHRGLKELTFDVIGSVKIELLEVDSTMRVSLPNDFQDYTFVGLVGEDGRLKPLGFRRDIPLVGTQNTLRPKHEPDHFIDDGIMGQGGVFGYGGGQNENGYYSPKIDVENNQMVLTSSEIGSFIYLEYISNGIVPDGESIVHEYAEEALTAYIYWKSIQRKKYISASEKELARRDYYNERRLAKSRFKGFTKEEALQVIRTGFKQSPKV